MYTKHQLEQMKKNEIINILLHHQSNNEKLDELLSQFSALSSKIEMMESKIAIADTTTSILVKEVKHLQKELYASQQYSRRECVEIVGIDKEIKDDDIEEKICEILEQINVDVDAEADIQACHRVRKKGTVIVKFTNRKTVGAIFKNKSALKNRKDKIFINESLCPYYRKLRGKCALLKKANKISKVIVRNGTVKLQINENGNFTIVDHDSVLKDQFPSFDFPF